MKTAKPTDWRTKALPSKRITIRLDRTFSPLEMKHIRRGFVPGQMEDKWFIYWKDDTLFFHKSWTGTCIYVVRFVSEGDSCRMIESDVNRDPEQYTETSDERDAEMISDLVDWNLLHGRIQMKTVKPTDWRAKALPSKRTTIRLDRTFSPQEMKHIRRGFVSAQMERRWFIYWKDDTLFFHCSWTGFCIYVVRFVSEGDSCRMIEADVNRDPEQYTEAGDERNIAEAEMISYLVDLLLLD